MNLHGALFLQRAGQHLEHLQVGIAGREGAERKRLIQAAEGELGPGIQLAGQFAEGGLQRFLVRGAVVLRDGLLRHEQREHLGFGDRQAGKVLDRFRVIIAVAPAVVFERQVEPILHEVDVPLDRPGGDFDLLGDPGAVGIAVALDLLVNAHHPLPRRPDQNVFLHLWHNSLSGLLPPVTADVKPVSLECGA